ncbi:MAG: methyltransferase domain-containing protein [Planctomycetes bacterium]|nr:methyltransferase domain-containing protein [Planctomycetota bacterium]
MDMWKYFAVTHADHTIMNPISVTKTLETVELLRLEENGHVLDIACGKAEFLCLAAERYKVKGTGVDASPFTSAKAKENVKARGLAGRIEILHMDGAKYEPNEAECYSMASCIGGSWVYGGHKGTLEALSRMTQPGGLVLVGEPFWKMEPDGEYLEKTGYVLEQQGSHIGNVKTGEELGLAFLYSAVSSKDDWDRYEGLQWQAAERYASSHPDDPDVEELLKKVHCSRDAYLRWGRECLGWALYLFRKP